MVSSIYPQDSNLLSFLDHHYTYNSSLGSESEEKALVASIRQVEEGTSEPLVKFLHLMLNSLCSLLVRPTVSAESGESERTLIRICQLSDTGLSVGHYLESVTYIM